MTMTAIDDHDLWSQANRLLQTYADRLDRADCDGVAALFTEDARWDYSDDLSLVGRDNILRYLREGMARFVQTHHHVGPAMLDRLPDGTLRSTAYFVASHHLEGDRHDTVCGRYVDTLAEGAHLAIASRQIVVHLTEGTDRSYRMIVRKPVAD